MAVYSRFLRKTISYLMLVGSPCRGWKMETSLRSKAGLRRKMDLEADLEECRAWFCHTIPLLPGVGGGLIPNDPFIYMCNR